MFLPKDDWYDGLDTNIWMLNPSQGMPHPDPEKGNDGGDDGDDSTPAPNKKKRARSSSPKRTSSKNNRNTSRPQPR